jgi:hypothetical protein
MKLKLFLVQSGLAALLAFSGAHAAVVPVTSDVTTDTTWTANNTYILQTVIYVRNNAELTIQPGTVIKAATTGLTPRTGVPNLVAALWVTRGAKLWATGTVERPITFTFDGDDLERPRDVPFNTSGQWGGIVLCGRARINSAQLVAGQAADPKYERFEGTTEDGPNGEHLFGGGDDNDNSGAMRYVSIRYPGTVFAPNRELNGLTMGAVGRGTDISYVEVFNSSDDGFEWWGGVVNTHHLIAAFCEDDDFDTDQGYRGTNQFWFGIKPPWQGSSDSRGFETDGDLNQTISGEAPKSRWTVHNATLIGRGKSVTGFGGGVGWNARDEAAPNVFNSIFAEFNTGVLIDDDGNAEFVNGQADLRNSIFDVTTGPSSANPNANVLFTDAARLNTVEDALLGNISYTNNLTLNPRPRAISPAFDNVAPQPAGLVTTDYRGAFSRRDHWADRWTALSQMGFLTDGRTTVAVTADITSDTTWSSNNTYVLQTVIYVRNNATLTIEPGTVIKAATTGLTPRTGVPNLVACLWVTRGAKLNAIGNVEQPIIFTFDEDNINNPYDVPFNTSGQWGGIVLCGNARINSAQLVAGQAADPKYERFEGTTEDGPNGEHLFGGANDNDDSGTLRYVSIRYPGTVFAPNRELNGLTMGAVGRGTDISYVEVFASSDDAFEWWGGVVNTHHLVAAFCEDDDFDTDQGYRGTNQFWFGIKPPWQGSSDSRGFETDGDLNQTISGEAPKSRWTVHNATLIGRGKSVTGFGGGVGWNARDEAAPNVFNSIFAEFNTGVLIDDDGNAEFINGQADLRNSIFDVTTGPSSANPNANVLFTDAARLNTVEAALLRGISYTNEMGLNPRPRPASPALDNVAPQGAGLTTTDYRGAFSTNDFWAHGWTAIYDLGYLAPTWFRATTPPPCSDNNSVLITRSGTDATITWSSQSGKTYAIQSKTDLNATTWNDELTGIAGTGGDISRDFPSGSGNKFYRVVCQ